jgi:hypothetical protein
VSKAVGGLKKLPCGSSRSYALIGLREKPLVKLVDFYSVGNK